MGTNLEPPTRKPAMSKKKRRGAITPEALMLIVFLFIVVLCIFAFLGRNRLTQGKIIKKIHENPSTNITVSPIIGSKDGGFVVGSSAEPEHWKFVIRGTFEGEVREEVHDVDRYEWESAKIGDYWNE